MTCLSGSQISSHLSRFIFDMAPPKIEPFVEKIVATNIPRARPAGRGVDSSQSSSAIVWSSGDAMSTVRTSESARSAQPGGPPLRPPGRVCSLTLWGALVSRLSGARAAIPLWNGRPLRREGEVFTRLSSSTLSPSGIFSYGTSTVLHQGTGLTR